MLARIFLIGTLIAFGTAAQDLHISGGKIRAHVKYLSSDELEGRGVGTKGEKLATEYIAGQLKFEGVNPGGDGGTYIMLTHRESLAEIDKERAESKKLMEAMGGEDAAAKMDQMFAAAVESARSELFTINPKQSYVDEATMKADADFWKPKAPKSAVAATAKPGPASATKPASR